MTSQERRTEQHMEIIWNVQNMDFWGCDRVAEISLKGILKWTVTGGREMQHLVTVKFAVFYMYAGQFYL